jgi:Predicted nucleoside-diphosphate-sugar epimerases
LKILLTGATGYIGGLLLPQLLLKGHWIRTLARDPEKLKKQAGSAQEAVQGDLIKKETLPAALHGVDVAYYLVHSLTGSEREFAEQDRLAATNFSRAARETGLKRIIYLGGLGADQASLSPHLKSRHEVGEILRSSGVGVTEFRAAIVVGANSVSFRMIRYLVDRLPIMICPRWVKSLCQPIASSDVIRYLLAALGAPECSGKILEIGGSDVLSYREMMMEYARVRGLSRLLIPVPVLTPRLSSYWLDLVTPISSAISRALIEGLRNDVVCTDSTAREKFPFQPLSYRQAVAAALKNPDS